MNSTDWWWYQFGGGSYHSAALPAESDKHNMQNVKHMHSWTAYVHVAACAPVRTQHVLLFPTLLLRAHF